MARSCFDPFVQSVTRLRNLNQLAQSLMATSLFRFKLRSQGGFRHTVGSGQFHFWPCMSLLVGSPSGYKFILKLADETLDRPRTRFTKCANSAPSRNVVCDLDQVIGVLL